MLEIAVGTGLNLPHYPDDVRLTGIEFVPAMLDIARRRAAELGRPVDLRLGDAQALEFGDSTFDTVVCTLSLCTIPDDRAAVAEVRRVLRPGGRFVLLEHVRSPVRAVHGVQRLLAPAFVLPGELRIRQDQDEPTTRSTGNKRPGRPRPPSAKRTGREPRQHQEGSEGRGRGSCCDRPQRWRARRLRPGRIASCGGEDESTGGCMTTDRTDDGALWPELEAIAAAARDRLHAQTGQDLSAIEQAARHVAEAAGAAIAAGASRAVIAREADWALIMSGGPSTSTTHVDDSVQGLGDQPHPHRRLPASPRRQLDPPARARRPKSLPRPAAVLSVCGTLLVGDEPLTGQRALHNSARRVTVTRKRSPASSDESKCSPISTHQLNRPSEGVATCRDTSF